MQEKRREINAFPDRSSRVFFKEKGNTREDVEDEKNNNRILSEKNEETKKRRKFQMIFIKK